MYKLYNDDCLNILKTIKDKSIDLLITDPPYLFIKGGSKCPRINRGIYDKNKEIKKDMGDFGKKDIYTFLENVNPKLKKTNMYLFCSKLQIPYYLNWAIEHKKNFDVLIWEKGRKGLLSHSQFATNIEYIIRIYENGCGLNAITQEGKLIAEWYQKIQSVKSDKNKEHPAQKPIELIKRLVLLSSNENDTILDCFMGSGSVGRASLDNNRNFIGVELNEKYYNIAKNRIENKDIFNMGETDV